MYALRKWDLEIAKRNHNELSTRLRVNSDNRNPRTTNKGGCPGPGPNIRYFDNNVACFNSLIYSTSFIPVPNEITNGPHPGTAMRFTGQDENWATRFRFHFLIKCELTSKTMIT